jgi:predicted GNAT family acetyltransferase
MSDDAIQTSEYPDEAGYPDGRGTLTEDQSVQVNEIAATAGSDHPRAFLAFEIVRDDALKRYTAFVGDEEVGTIAFEPFGSRIALIHTKVEPDYRGQGIASELIWRVLDDLRSRGETVTVICPLVHAFIVAHPSYVSLVDATKPGL